MKKKRPDYLKLLSNPESSDFDDGDGGDPPDGGEESEPSFTFTVKGKLSPLYVAILWGLAGYGGMEFISDLIRHAKKLMSTFMG